VRAYRHAEHSGPGYGGRSRRSQVSFRQPGRQRLELRRKGSCAEERGGGSEGRAKTKRILAGQRLAARWYLLLAGNRDFRSQRFRPGTESGNVVRLQFRRGGYQRRGEADARLGAKYRDGIIMARTPQVFTTDRLFVNGSRQPMARDPNYNPVAVFRWMVFRHIRQATRSPVGRSARRLYTRHAP